MSHLILGVINIAIVVTVLIIVGLLVLWFMKLLMNTEPSPQLQKAYMVLVGLIALYMIVALIFGLPSYTVLPLR